MGGGNIRYRDKFVREWDTARCDDGKIHRRNSTGDQPQPRMALGPDRATDTP
jgi:hypothetical protein